MVAVRFMKKIGEINEYGSINLNIRAEGEIYVTMSFEQQQLSHSSCSECKNRGVCHHVLCAIWYRIKHADKVPLHMPLTESLESLNKFQLQHLLHQTVLTNPGLHLMALFGKYDEVRTSRQLTTNDASGLLEDLTYGYAGTDTYFSMKLKETRRSFIAYLNNLEDPDIPDNDDYSDDIWEMDPEFNDFILIAKRTYYPDELQNFADMLKMLTTEAIKHTLEYPTILVVENRARRLLRCLSLLVMWPAAAPIREQILDHVRQCSQWLSELDVKRLDHKDWVELPSLIGSQEAHLLQPLVAAKYLPWPTELEDLHVLKFDGTDITAMQEFVKNSSYDEDLGVMVARYEAIRTFSNDVYGDLTGNESVLLSLKILQKATNIMIQDSVLGAYLGLPRTEETASVQDNIVKVFNIEEHTLRKLKQVYSHLGDSALETADGTCRKRKADNPDDTTAKQQKVLDGGAEVMENTNPSYKQANIYTGDTVVGNLTKHQVVFTMLDICKWQYEWSDFDVLVLPYIQLALELSRSFAVTNDHMPSKREKSIAHHHAWQNLETDQFRYGCDILQNEYLKAFQRFGARCFDGEYPFFLGAQHFLCMYI
eukprot:GHVU01107760.1.p1 GENE.GHVU01107760.1~~GHVU01107760.1.p1  ORF type:complete len:595 (-),score=69.31 GHVU01107760.1:1755-3539(-)